MSDFNDSSTLFINCIKQRFKSYDDELLSIQEKLINELDYNPEIFSTDLQLIKMKDDLSMLLKSFNTLYVYKREFIIVLQSQLNLMSILTDLEKSLECTTVVDNRHRLLADHILSLWNDTSCLESNVTTTIGSISTSPKSLESDEITFIPITEGQFDTVPTLVRRRVKLEQLNEFYKFLFTDALKNNICLPIRLRDISKSGIKVFGQTGSAKVYTLRYLKVIDFIPKEGIVQLLDDRFKRKK